MANDAPERFQIDTATTATDKNDNNQNNGNMENMSADVEPEATNSASTDPRSGDNVECANPERDLDRLFQEIGEFAACLSSIDKSLPLETPQFVDVFLEKFESKIHHYESLESSSNSRFGHSPKNDELFLKAVDHLALLIDSVSKFKSVSNAAAVLLNLATSQLHRAMLVLEDELRVLLNKWKIPPTNPSDSKDQQESQVDHCTPRDHQENLDSDQQREPVADTFPPYLPEDISTMSSISRTMILAGYRVECIRLLVIIRRSAFEEEMTSQGFEKKSIDDVQRMQWETLESEIATWINLLKRCTCNLFPGELKFYQAVFSSTLSQVQPGSKIWMVLFSDLASSVIQQLVNLAHAVAMTKRSSEKLFKFLDMYETLRDLASWLDESSFTKESIKELRTELTAAGSRLGKAAVSIFCELESSIKTDNTKQPVACGAVHPLTRYTMNYLKYACEYKDSLEELFLCHLNDGQSNNGERAKTPFMAQMMVIMDLMDANLDAKSKLYKDPSLRYIFLMNNGRYMLQKIKGSAEMHQAVGDSWYRKKSSDVRSYHKNYQRDTWSKVLQCLSHEGLQVNGKVQKPVLKERFKNFNQLFDEIHKTQSTWVVSDEQLQSELRVSISAVMIPAYRAFLARFGQIFTPGRQYEKHIKYQPEDIEAAIEELFDGNTNSMARRRT